MEYTNGYAFICEGATEKEFYLSFLNYMCRKHDASLNKIVRTDNPDTIYELATCKGTSIVKFHTVNAITQMPRAGKWFNSQCVLKYNSSCLWTVFLCYDMDDYMPDISKFFKDDWSLLRSSLKKAKEVKDIAAAADIEDVMLGDLKGICNFIGCAMPDTLSGSKGKAKLKNLYRNNGLAYHEGTRARSLIDNLDMDLLVKRNTVDLSSIETIIFK